MEALEGEDAVGRSKRRYGTGGSAVGTELSPDESVERELPSRNPKPFRNKKLPWVNKPFLPPRDDYYYTLSTLGKKRYNHLRMKKYTRELAQWESLAQSLAQAPQPRWVIIAPPGLSTAASVPGAPETRRRQTHPEKGECDGLTEQVCNRKPTGCEWVQFPFGLQGKCYAQDGSCSDGIPTGQETHLNESGRLAMIAEEEDPKDELNQGRQPPLTQTQRRNTKLREFQEPKVALGKRAETASCTATIRKSVKDCREKHHLERTIETKTREGAVAETTRGEEFAIELSSGVKFLQRQRENTRAPIKVETQTKTTEKSELRAQLDQEPRFHSRRHGRLDWCCCDMSQAAMTITLTEADIDLRPSALPPVTVALGAPCAREGCHRPTTGNYTHREFCCDNCQDGKPYHTAACCDRCETYSKRGFSELHRQPPAVNPQSQTATADDTHAILRAIEVAEEAREDLAAFIRAQKEKLKKIEPPTGSPHGTWESFFQTHPLEYRDEMETWRFPGLLREGQSGGTRAIDKRVKDMLDRRSNAAWEEDHARKMEGFAAARDVRSHRHDRLPRLIVDWKGDRGIRARFKDGSAIRFLPELMTDLTTPEEMETYYKAFKIGGRVAFRPGDLVQAVDADSDDDTQRSQEEEWKPSLERKPYRVQTQHIELVKLSLPLLLFAPELAVASPMAALGGAARTIGRAAAGTSTLVGVIAIITAWQFAEKAPGVATELQESIIETKEENTRGATTVIRDGWKVIYVIIIGALCYLGKTLLQGVVAWILRECRRGGGTSSDCISDERRRRHAQEEGPPD